MKLLIMQFSPTSCHLIPVRSKYSPQHPVLKTPSVQWLKYIKFKVHFRLTCHQCFCHRPPNYLTFVPPLENRHLK
jgi:hypothetical protein